MNQETKTTLKKIFEAHGLDPFDAFFLPKHKWPQEARDLVAADRPAMLEDAEKRAEASEHRRQWAEEYDRWEEG